MIEELEKSRMAMYQIVDLLKTNNWWLEGIRHRLEDIIGHESIEREGDFSHVAQAPFPPPPPEMSPEQAAQSTQTEATLEMVEASDDYSSGHPKAESSPESQSQEGARSDDAEKARRVRHGEGLDLDEPQF